MQSEGRVGNRQRMARPSVLYESRRLWWAMHSTPLVVIGMFYDTNYFRQFRGQTSHAPREKHHVYRSVS